MTPAATPLAQAPAAFSARKTATHKGTAISVKPMAMGVYSPCEGRSSTSDAEGERSGTPRSCGSRGVLQHQSAGGDADRHGVGAAGLARLETLRFKALSRGNPAALDCGKLFANPRR